MWFHIRNFGCALVYYITKWFAGYTTRQEEKDKSRRLPLAHNWWAILSPFYAWIQKEAHATVNRAINTFISTPCVYSILRATLIPYSADVFCKILTAGWLTGERKNKALLYHYNHRHAFCHNIFPNKKHVLLFLFIVSQKYIYTFMIIQKYIWNILVVSFTPPFVFSTRFLPRSRRKTAQ